MVRLSSTLQRAFVPLCVAIAVAFAASACGDPQVPVAASSSAVLVEATSVPVPATPTPIPVPTPVPTPEPSETEEEDEEEEDVPPPPALIRQPGLSFDTIRIAVIFDDETQGSADRLFRDAWWGAKAWENEVNFNGGLGGRDVLVVPFDSRLFDHRSAIEQVCEGDYFAIIGSHSLGDSEGAELLGTEDCNIADFAGQVYGSRRAVSPVTFLSNPFLNDVRQAGPARYLIDEFPEAAENLGLLQYFELDLADASERQREMLLAQGMELALELPVELDEDLADDRVVGRWEESGADSLVWTADPERLIQLLEALEEPPTFVLCEWGCYSQQFPIDGGEAVDGVYTWIAHSPFQSATEKGDLVLYRANLARVFGDEAGWSEVGLQSWMSGRLFEETFRALIQDEPEAPSREQLIAKAREQNFFTANGVLSATDPGGGQPTPCFALMVVRDGRWEQEYPDPLAPRDQDCSEDNLYELVTSRSLGVAAISATQSEEQPEVDLEEQPPDLENPEELDE